MKPALDLSVEDIDDVKITTKYCVEQDLHNLHVQKAIAAGYPPIPVAKPDEIKQGPIAIVCSGPSLKDTWQELVATPFGGMTSVSSTEDGREPVPPPPTILTCSGAHDYLLERGIVPTFHMETDPRAHKAVFTKNPRREITYLIASNCHPAVFDNLKGHDVRLWHVSGDKELHKYPRGHWLITGGCNVGLRAMVMARLLGYIDIHIFGMDCCASRTDGENPENKFHVNDHPNEPKPKGHRVVKVGDREFQSCDVFIECARQFFKETLLLSDARCTLHGDGLLQALALQKMSDPKQIEKRKEWIEKKGPATIALSLPETITPKYAELNQKLHETNPHYGGHGDRYLAIVKKLAETKGIKTVLDYGCGKGALAKALDFPIWEYDPAIPGKDAPPAPADLVICTDVLEHIEPEHLAATMEDLRRVVKFSAFFTIHTGASCKTLADGRNTHLIQQGKDAWRALLSNYFGVAYCEMVRDTPVLYAVVSAVRAGRADNKK